MFLIFIQRSVLKKVELLDESLIGQNCVANYDGVPYPGTILDVDEEHGCEIKVMNKIGVNRFFWPLIEDRCWYKIENIITILDTAPQPVTKRHVEIDHVVWKAIVEELNLDS